ncbi:MAG: (2R)-sulfolactate sulfo-lyase subunit alpha, partial [uncultured Rubrobacteraceae bacterium]
AQISDPQGRRPRRGGDLGHRGWGEGGRGVHGRRLDGGGGGVGGRAPGAQDRGGGLRGLGRRDGVRVQDRPGHARLPQGRLRAHPQPQEREVV